MAGQRVTRRRPVVCGGCQRDGGETPQGGGETPRSGGLADVGQVATSQYVVDRLRDLLNSDDTPAAAKATAARTLAEMEGRIGRHQIAPSERLAVSPVSALTRADLEQELARLRTLCAVSPS
jgi:hypothetical protein